MEFKYYLIYGFGIRFMLFEFILVFVVGFIFLFVLNVFLRIINCLMFLIKFGFFWMVCKRYLWDFSVWKSDEL